MMSPTLCLRLYCRHVLSLVFINSGSIFTVLFAVGLFLECATFFLSKGICNLDFMLPKRLYPSRSHRNQIHSVS